MNFHAANTDHLQLYLERADVQFDNPIYTNISTYIILVEKPLSLFTLLRKVLQRWIIS